MKLGKSLPKEHFYCEISAAALLVCAKMCWRGKKLGAAKKNAGIELEASCYVITFFPEFFLSAGLKMTVVSGLDDHVVVAASHELTKTRC